MPTLCLKSCKKPARRICEGYLAEARSHVLRILLRACHLNPPSHAVERPLKRLVSIACLCAIFGAAAFQFGCENSSTSQGRNPGPTFVWVCSAAFSPDRAFLLSGYASSFDKKPQKIKRLVLWNIKTDTQKWFTQGTENLYPVGFLPDNKTALVRGGFDSLESLQVWDIVEGKFIRGFGTLPNLYVNCAALSEDGKVIIAGYVPKNFQPGDAQPTLSVWDVSSGACCGIWPRFPVGLTMSAYLRTESSRCLSTLPQHRTSPQLTYGI